MQLTSIEQLKINLDYTCSAFCQYILVLFKERISFNNSNKKDCLKLNHFMSQAFQLHIANELYRAEDILHWNETHADPYVYDVLMYCKKWLSGHDVFELNTSGSTGTPKTIPIKREQIVASATLSLHFFNLKAGDKVCCPLSIYVVGGQMMLYRSMIGGLDLYVIPPSKNLEGLDTTISYVFMPISGLQLFGVLSQGNQEKIQTLNQLHNLLIGGSSISNGLLVRIHQTLRCTVWHSYGMTETVSHVAMKNVWPKNEEAYTLLEGVEMDIDERSCLRIKGAVTQHAWIQTNDCVSLRDKTHFNFLGRVDFTVNSGGIKIQVEPIEKKVDSLFDSLSIGTPFFVGAVADDVLGEKLTLFINDVDWSTEKKELILIKLIELLPKYHVRKSIFCIENIVLLSLPPHGKMYSVLLS